MLTALRTFPPLVNLVLIGAALMLLPALHGLWLGEGALARIFAGNAVFFFVVGTMIGIATMRPGRRMRPARQILSLLLAYLTLPAMLAAPLVQILPTFTGGQLYFEMLSSLTTTGATVFDEPGRIPDPVHLWRGLVAWAGGFLILVAAVAVLEPLQLGGFEIQAAIQRGQGQERRSQGAAVEPSAQLAYHATRIFPAYAGLTAALTLGLVMAGDRTLVAAVHAMSVLSTSGITPLDDFSLATSGHVGELLVFAFLLVALTRGATTLNWPRGNGTRFDPGPEYKLAAVTLLGVALLLFLRHFIGAYEVSGQEDLPGAIGSFWGALFNGLSFLSTTGFNSRDWDIAQSWSGLETPGLILLTLCMMGGGIATTTGGVKLLRVYALYKHGVREMQRMIHPNSVGGAGVTARRIRREGAQIAFVFVMLFLLGASLLLLGLTLFGTDFDAAMGLSVAALTNTGPSAHLIVPNLSYALLDDAQRALLCVGMVFGRLEALVLISLLNPEYWRQ